MPDVRMPDGTIIRNVPEGTTRAQLMARLGKRQAPNVSKSRSGLLGFGDSRAFGFLDEGGAVLDTLGIGGSGENRPNIWKGNSFSEAYNANLKRNRQQLGEAQSANPGSYMTGQIVGAVLPGPSSKAVAGTKIGKSLHAAQTTAKTTRAGKAGRIAAQAAPDIARGAAYGTGSAEGGIAQRAKGAVEGAKAGIAGHAAGRTLAAGASRVLRGGKVSAAVKELDEAGVTMTPGKRGGAVKRFWEEGILGSLPFVREIPKAANRRSVGQFNVAWGNKVLEPIGVKLPTNTTPGHEFVRKVGDVAYEAYDESMTELVLGQDSGLKGAANSITKGARASVGQNANQLTALVNQTLAPLEKGPISGVRVRDMLKDLRGQASQFMRSTSANEQNIGKELWKLHDHLDAALVRQNKAGNVERFKAAREAVARLHRFHDAAAKGKGGVFSPQMARTASTKRGFGMTTAKAAEGTDPMQRLADSASQVLPDVLPSSGTTERAAGLAAVGGATGVPGIAALMDPTMGAATGLSLGGYVPGADKMLQYLALHRPDLFIRAGAGIDRASPAIGTAGAMTSLGINSQP